MNNYEQFTKDCLTMLYLSENCFWRQSYLLEITVNITPISEPVNGFYLFIFVANISTVQV